MSKGLGFCEGLCPLPQKICDSFRGNGILWCILSFKSVICTFYTAVVIEFTQNFFLTSMRAQLPMSRLSTCVLQGMMQQL